MSAPADVYQEVTDTVLAALAEGTVPWRRPWQASAGDGLHRNLSSKRPYRGINQFLLDLQAIRHGYESPYWLTFKGAKKAGGNVRAGEKSTLVVFWKRLAIEDKETGEKKVIPMLRHFRVFNVAQCDGIETPAPVDRPDDFDPCEEAEAILAGYPSGPTVAYGGDRACYVPALDAVRLPAREAFDAPEAFYQVAFHELAHSTGHASRLDRPELRDFAAFGDHAYCKEELTAEMAAAMLGAVAGIGSATIAQTAAYVDHWRRKISDDPKLVVHAAARAQRAADHIRAITFDTDES